MKKIGGQMNKMNFMIENLKKIGTFLGIIEIINKP